MRDHKLTQTVPDAPASISSAAVAAGRASAPGKLVVSGAYAVLHGAPAVVTAVDRYVVAEAQRTADFEAPEVRQAIPQGPLPWFDASALRDGDRKLGLGSSAAIVVASLAAVACRQGVASDGDLQRVVFEPALAAHRAAQGGGSGVDVAAATYGGTQIVRKAADGALTLSPARFHESLRIQVWFSGRAASTAGMLRAVEALGRSRPTEHEALMSEQAAAAEATAQALEGRDPDGFLQGLRRQLRALDALGAAAAIPIVTTEVRRLAHLAEQEHGAVLPSGAGGGDVALFAGPWPPSKALQSAARDLGLSPLAGLHVGARGVHLG